MAPPSDSQLVKCIQQDFSLSQVSKSNYVKRLQSMALARGSAIFNLIKDSKKTLKWIASTYTENASRKALVTSILALIKRSALIHSRLGKSTCLEDWRMGSRELSAKQTLRYAKPKPNARESAKFIPFQEICKMRDSLNDLSPDKILLGFFSWVAPSRAELGEVRILLGKKGATCPPPLEKMKKFPNVLWIPRDESKNGKLILRAHKTKGNYSAGKPLTKNVPWFLTSLVRKSLVYSPRSFLFTSASGFPFTNSHFSKHVTRRIAKLFPERAIAGGINTLRHSWISHWVGEGHTLSAGNKEFLASQCGHGISLQAQYVWKPEDIMSQTITMSKKVNTFTTPKFKSRINKGTSASQNLTINLM